MTVDYSELEGLVKSLERASNPQKYVRMVLHAAGSEVERRARDYAPVKSGKLRSSIVMIAEGNQVRVVARAPHAIFVEFGTWSHNIHNPKSGTYTIRPVNKQALRFTTGGKTVFAKKVEHPGIEPQLFMTRANTEVAEILQDHLANLGMTMVVE